MADAIDEDDLSSLLFEVLCQKRMTFRAKYPRNSQQAMAASEAITVVYNDLGPEPTFEQVRDQLKERYSLRRRPGSLYLRVVWKQVRHDYKLLLFTYIVCNTSVAYHTIQWASLLPPVSSQWLYPTRAPQRQHRAPQLKISGPQVSSEGYGRCIDIRDAER